MAKNNHSHLLYILYLSLLSTIFSACGYKKEQPEVSIVYDSLSTDRLLISGIMINGRKYGVWNTYYKNGQIMSVETFVDDTLNGIRISYREEGMIGIISHYKNGLKEGKYLLYYDYPDHLAAKRYFSKDKKVGIWEDYHENGKLEKRVEYDEYEREKVLVDNTIPLPENPE